MGLSDLFANNLLVKLLRGDNSRYELIASMVGTRLGDRGPGFYRGPLRRSQRGASEGP